jgi:hypothetical protein
VKIAERRQIYIGKYRIEYLNLFLLEFSKLKREYSLGNKEISYDLLDALKVRFDRI